MQGITGKEGPRRLDEAFTATRKTEEKVLKKKGKGGKKEEGLGGQYYIENFWGREKHDTSTMITGEKS